MPKVFSDEAAKQYEQIARTVLGQKPGELGKPFVFPPRGQNHQFLRVTGPGTTAGGKTYYPARLTLKNPSTGAWADRTPAVDIWLEDRNGVDLVTDGTKVYLAKQLLDSFDVSGTVHALFVTDGPGECPNSTGSFPLIDETNSGPTTKLLATDPTLGTRNLQLKDLGKAAQKAAGVFAITYSATPTWDLHNGLRQRLTMLGNPTISIAGDWDGAMALLETVQDGTGGRVPTFGFTTITWKGQIAPRPTLTPNARDLYVFERIGSGNYRGDASLNR